MINELKTEVFDKTNYIDRLKREKQTLLDEAEYSEDRLVRENSALKQRLSQLARNSLEQVTNAPRKLASSSTQTLFQEEILLQNDSQTDPCLAGSSDEKQQALMIEIAEITNLNKQMATSIETLDNENRFLSSELEDLKEQLACLHVSHGKPSGVPSLSTKDQFFLANRVEDGRRVSVLLTSITEEVYIILRNICHPEKPSSKSFLELVDLLSGQFIPKVSVYRKRIVFNLLRQKEESINECSPNLPGSDVVLPEILSSSSPTSVERESSERSIAESDVLLLPSMQTLVSGQNSFQENVITTPVKTESNCAKFNNFQLYH
ncbi:unnamed protein product [Ceutorhynchus assimilis]|uniref:Uncharacterized protein n=1 Tax=Ceutorhynchus assimilis TaxID=467358 RepID=A0A9N9QJL2_9CUCU|nr:unnamed protein product [Ceutorhynchus assimilis]